MTGRFSFFLSRKAILAAFVLSALVSGLTGAVAGAENSWSLAGLSVAVFAVLAYFTYQRQILATWTTILVLLVNGSGFLYDGLTVLVGNREGPWAFVPVQIVVGVYLTWGALVLHRERHIED